MKTTVCCCLFVILAIAAAPASAGSDHIDRAYPEDEAAVKQAVHGVFESIRNGELDDLAKHHLDSNKFTKWPDDGRAVVLGYDAAVELETAIFSTMTKFEYEVRNLRVDVIGPVAIATFVISYEIAFGEEQMAAAERSTLVFAKKEGDWQIVHEHFSQVVAEE
jgi:ketosteroid isomerase-like protein